MQHQIDCLRRYVDVDDIMAVVGFKKELIMEAFPDLAFIYNEQFDTTNTAKSLLRALRKLQGYDVLWLNGDVVFDDAVIERVASHPGTCMAVNVASVGEEEVKYATDDDGVICQVSKEVVAGQGEAVGINKIDSENVPLLINCLAKCADGDYFEKAIELAIADGLKVWPVDVSDLVCTEVDFIEDLLAVNVQLMSAKSCKAGDSALAR